VDGVQAAFWVEIGYIPESPEYTTVYIYYGNPNVTTTSNKDWAFDFTTDFEDGTTQGWEISWNSHITVDGVTTPGFQGNYSRVGGRVYGSSYAGTGDFLEYFHNIAYLTSGSYRMEGAARQTRQTDYIFPQYIKLLVSGVMVDNVTTPNTAWHWLEGNFTIDTSNYVELKVEFHMWTPSGLKQGSQGYLIDSLFVRKWCNPEPTHGSWGVEQSSADNTPPEILSVEWTPTCPYPYLPSNQTRVNEPTQITANVTEPVSESGVANVQLSYRVDSGEWWNTTMTYNMTTGLYTTTIPGQLGNSTIDFLLTASDNSGNMIQTSVCTFNVKALIAGDIDGDGHVFLYDLTILGSHWDEYG
jgi:hypothetical protein